MVENGDKQSEEQAIGRVFRVSLIVKAALSLLEIICGAGLYFTSGDRILHITRRITAHELLEHPNAIVANFVLRSAETLSIDRKSAAALYLLSHGLVKLFLVVMVLRGKLWAYPLFLIALTLLIAYQTYLLTFGFSPWLFGLTVFDVVVLALTWHEYQRQPG